MDKFLILSFVALNDGEVECIEKNKKFVMRKGTKGSLVENLDNGEIGYLEMDLLTKKGITKRYFSNGVLRFIFEHNGGIKNGVFREYWPTGQLYAECTFKNDLREGKEIKYIQNGNIMSVHIYMNGKINGVSEFYYSNGSMAKEIIYRDDIITFVRNYDNHMKGILIEEFYFKNGKKNGEYYEYYPNGVCKRECFYTDNILHGIETIYDTSRKIISQNRYVNGTKMNF
jgi:antitoxin component YwqK of YwqJK toxin-antitoxin module